MADIAAEATPGLPTRIASPAGSLDSDSPTAPRTGQEAAISPQPAVEHRIVRMSDELPSETDGSVEVRKLELPVIRGTGQAMMPALPPTEASAPRAHTREMHARTAPSRIRTIQALYAPAPIENLIERTVRPVPVPGLKIRVLDRAPREASNDRIRNDTDQAETSSPRRPVAAPPAAPQLNIDAVADKVYRLLQRRQRFERERTGRY
jgi:hypothetical protein